MIAIQEVTAPLQSEQYRYQVIPFMSSASGDQITSGFIQRSTFEASGNIEVSQYTFQLRANLRKPLSANDVSTIRLVKTTPKMN